MARLVVARLGVARLGVARPGTGWLAATLAGVAQPAATRPGVTRPGATHGEEARLAAPQHRALVHRVVGGRTFLIGIGRLPPGRRVLGRFALLQLARPLGENCRVRVLGHVLAHARAPSRPGAALPAIARGHRGPKAGVPKPQAAMSEVRPLGAGVRPSAASDHAKLERLASSVTLREGQLRPNGAAAPGGRAVPTATVRVGPASLRVRAGPRVPAGPVLASRMGIAQERRRAGGLQQTDAGTGRMSGARTPEQDFLLFRETSQPISWTLQREPSCGHCRVTSLNQSRDSSWQPAQQTTPTVDTTMRSRRVGWLLASALFARRAASRPTAPGDGPMHWPNCEQQGG